MNNYELQGAIGQGQYGTAYKARHRLDGQLYCIKRIGLSAKDDQSAALKEVQLLAQLDHPNIIGYKESFLDPKDGALCIVTSFCEEGDLFNRIRKRQQANQYFTEQEVMDMFIQIASALMHIHSKRILHRDLKTQNIFIARGGIIKLGDFGISKVLEKTDQFATTVTGTPYYMAPEICTNQPYTFKSDIWSLGCVLYELCTLKHAFAADSLLSLVYQIVRGNFPPIPANQFSQGLSTLVSNLLVRDTAQRPSLSQIFQMPFVLENLHRYNNESKRNLMKHNNTMTKRRQAIERTQEAMNTTEQADDGSLTPKERLAKKKEQERQRREMELQLASMNMHKDRGVAAQRKAANILGSNPHGLPGSTLPAGDTSAGRDASSPTVSTPPLSDVGFLDNSMVNMGTVMMGTMPAFTAGADTRGKMSQAGTTMKATDPGNQTKYDSYDSRPIRPSSRQQQSSSTPSASSMGDTVLMGSGMYGNTMVNMGTMNLAAGQTMAHTASKTAGSTLRTNNDRPSVSSGSQRAVLTPAPVVPSNIVGGFKFGLTNGAGMPSLPVFPVSSQRPTTPSPTARTPSPTPASKIKFGISSNSQPRGSFEYVIKTGSGGQSGQSDDEDYDEGGYDYEDDFEDYNPADDQETIKDKCKILNNMQDLERSRGKGALDDSISQVHEKIGASTKNSKAAALRERCQASLGFHFPGVYTYLRRIRTQEPGIEEWSVQKQLHELVGGDRLLLQGCFLVDQLVFQEMMYC